MVHRSVWLPLLILLSAWTPALGQETDGAADPPVALFFADELFGREEYNFTTYPPSASDEGARIQLFSMGTSARFAWSTDGVPAPWNATHESPSRGFVHLSGLDEVFPHPPQDPEQAAATVGHVEIRIRVSDQQDGTVMEGAVLFQPQPWAPRDDVFVFEIALQAETERTVTGEEGDDHLTVELLVSGRNLTQSNISPVHVHIGAEDTPSRVELGDFPYEAFRVWEDAQEQIRENNKEVLRGGGRNATSSPQNGTGGDQEQAATPAPEALIPLIGLLAILAQQRTKISRRAAATGISRDNNS